MTPTTAYVPVEGNTIEQTFDVPNFLNDKCD